MTKKTAVVQYSRVTRGMKQLFRPDWYDLFGFSVPAPALADSGIAYLGMEQSRIGVVMRPLFLYVQPTLQRSEQRLYIHAAALSFTLSILVSISMLSINTAAFCWFLMGMIIVMPRPPDRLSGGRG